MESKINLSEYLSGGIENIIKNIIKSSIKNPRESSFMVKEMVNAKNLKAKYNNLPIKERLALAKKSMPHSEIITVRD